MMNRSFSLLSSRNNLGKLWRNRVSYYGTSAVLLNSSDDSSSKLVLIEQIEHKGELISKVLLNNKPVNSLNRQTLLAITDAIKTVENDGVSKGIMLASNVDRIFSAGLDITEMHEKSNAYMSEFWRALQQCWLTLYGCPLATVAAVKGASPAAGCLLHISCDYRVMAEGKHTTGMNETQFGLVAPPFFVDSMNNTVGHRKTEYLIQTGELITPTEALQVGIVDQVVEMDRVDEVALDMLTKFTKVKQDARKASKMALRRETLQRLEDNYEKGVSDFVAMASSGPVQKNVGMYMQMLRSRKGR